MAGFGSDFFDDSVDNPFQDPAVTNVTRNTINHPDDIDPFEAPPTRPVEARNSGPAIMQLTPQEVTSGLPAYAKSGQQSIDAAALERRERDLQMKEAELQRREEELRNSTTYNLRKNNWPPLPENFCFQPCFYQDIDVEIKIEFQRIVRHLYYLWLFHGCMMILNVFGGLTLLIDKGDFTTFCVGILYVLLFTPFSFLCWYRPIYKAFRSDSSFNFMVFFFVFFFQFVVTSVLAIGLDSSGACGIVKAIKCFDGTTKGVIVGIILLFIAIGFIILAAGELLLLTKVHSIYRASGASFAKAQEEFTTEFLRNEHVQNVATNAAAATVRSQFGNQQPNRR